MEKFVDRNHIFVHNSEHANYEDDNFVQDGNDNEYDAENYKGQEENFGNDIGKNVDYECGTDNYENNEL